METSILHDLVCMGTNFIGWKGVVEYSAQSNFYEYTYISICNSIVRLVCNMAQTQHKAVQGHEAH